jgi:hypothetical protein
MPDSRFAGAAAIVAVLAVLAVAALLAPVSSDADADTPANGTLEWYQQNEWTQVDSADGIQYFYGNYDGNECLGVAATKADGTANDLPETWTVPTEVTSGDTTYEFDALYGVESATLKNLTIPAGIGTVYGPSLDKCPNLETAECQNTGAKFYASVFMGHEKLQKVTLPDGAKTVAGNVGVSMQTFRNCPALTEVTLPSGMTEIGDNAFAGCTSLTSFEIPSTVTKIGPGAFAGSGIEELTVPSTVTTVTYNSMFSGCSSLKTVTIGNQVTEISNWEFKGCAALETININGTAVDMENMVLPAGIQRVGDRAFEGCTQIVSAEVPEDTWGIMRGAFAGCTSLESVELSSARSVFDGAFEGCTSLKTIELPESLGYLGKNVFTGSAVESLTIPEHARTISQCALAGAESLKEVEFKCPVTKLYQGMFCGDTALEQITFADGSSTEMKDLVLTPQLATVGKNLFAGCTQIESVTLGTDTVKISEGAFAGCTSLTTVSIPLGADPGLVIEPGAFADCPAELTVRDYSMNGYSDMGGHEPVKSYGGELAEVGDHPFLHPGKDASYEVLVEDAYSAEAVFESSADWVKMEDGKIVVDATGLEAGTTATFTLTCRDQTTGEVTVTVSGLNMADTVSLTEGGNATYANVDNGGTVTLRDAPSWLRVNSAGTGLIVTGAAAGDYTATVVCSDGYEQTVSFKVAAEQTETTEEDKTTEAAVGVAAVLIVCLLFGYAIFVRKH